MVVSERVFEIVEKMLECGWYFDLFFYKKFNEKKKGMFLILLFL